MENENAKFCPNCGKQLASSDADVCLNCGKELNQSNIPSPNNNKSNKGLPWWAILLISLGVVISLIVGFVSICYSIYEAVENVDVDINDYFENEIFNYTEEGTIGDTLTYDDEFEVTLDKALIYDKIEGDTITDTPSAGKKYLVMYLTVKNISSSNEYFNYLYMKGYSDGNDTGSNIHLFNKPDNLDLMNGYIEPGMTKKGYIAYEVDENFQSFEFIYREIYDDEAIKFTILGKDNTSYY